MKSINTVNAFVNDPSATQHTTYIAHVRPLASVRAHVHLQRVVLAEHDVALGAL